MYFFLAVEPPTFTPYYETIKWVMLIEVVIVLIVGIFSILLQWLLVRSRKRSEKLFVDVKGYFLHLLAKNRPFKRQEFPAKLADLSAVLAAILEIDNERKDPQWGSLKDEIGTQYVLQKARNLIKRPRWTNKLKALRCFALFAEQQDEKQIVKLLDHKIPVVRYAAAHAAIRVGTKSAIQELLNVMSRSSRFLRQPVHDALVKGGEKTFSYVEKCLEIETDPFARLSCIELAQERMSDHIVSLIEKDLQAEHKNLRIGAIRALGHYQSPRSVALLLPLLHDPEWEVRALSARSLGYLKAKEAVGELEKLCRDQTWWVRMNAALALKRLGSEGIKILEEMKQETDLYAYETAQYVLSLAEE